MKKNKINLDIFEKFLFDISGNFQEEINKKLILLIEKIGFENLKNNNLYLELLKFENLKEELKNIKTLSSKKLILLDKDELEKLEKDIISQAKKIEKIFNEIKESYNYIKIK